jgi:hypothetical protein
LIVSQHRSVRVPHVPSDLRWTWSAVGVLTDRKGKSSLCDTVLSFRFFGTDFILISCKPVIGSNRLIVYENEEDCLMWLLTKYVYTKTSPISEKTLSSSGVPRNIFRWVGGGSTNSVEDRGQRERGSAGGSPLVRGSAQFANE